MAVASAVSHAVSAGNVLGFRLLTFDGSMVRWGGNRDSPPVVTYAIARNNISFPSARNLQRAGTT